MSRHEERLAELERDLRFHPVRCENPRRLTQNHIAFFNERGYLKGFRIFEEPEVSENRRGFDQLLDRAVSDGGSSYSINGWHDRSQTIYDLATHPVILEYVEDLLGPNVVAWGTHYFCKLPGDGKAVSWHQDASYWPLTPARTVTVWLAIDDADRENGCMRVIPGTHRLGQLEFRDSDASENNVLWQTVTGAERYGEPVDFELKAGEISLHADMLVHGSEPNRSSRRRCGLTIRYASTDVRAYWDWNQKSILCRGEDPGGHWAHLPRPAGDG
jgi:non-haem Fe2+, alpha-ketoglutarate-dependent halogenase